MFFDYKRIEIGDNHREISGITPKYMQTKQHTSWIKKSTWKLQSILNRIKMKTKSKSVGCCQRCT